MRRRTALALATSALLLSAFASHARAAAVRPACCRVAPSTQASASPRVVYVSNQPYDGPTQILEYPTAGASPSPVAQITSGLTTPGGMAVDGAGNLYVANGTGGTGGSGFVAIYPSGASSPTATLSNALSNVTNVLVGPHGRVYVAQSGGVVEFQHGSSIPDRAIGTGLHTVATGLALDPHENLYVAYDDVNGLGDVMVVPKGALRGKPLGLKVRTPVGIALDAVGNLIVSQGSLGRAAIDVFAPGSQTPKVLVSNGLILPQYLSLANGRLYVADADAHAVFEYAYPSGTLLRTITSQLVRADGVLVARGV